MNYTFAMPISQKVLNNQAASTDDNDVHADLGGERS